MASHLRISGPLFVRSRQKDKLRFSLLLSNLSVTSVLVGVKVYAAAFSGPDTAVTWVKIVDEEFLQVTGETKTLAIRVDKRFEYYRFHVENSLPNLCFHTALYLLAGRHKPRRAIPLVVGNEWEILEI